MRTPLNPLRSSARFNLLRFSRFDIVAFFSSIALFVLLCVLSRFKLDLHHDGTVLIPNYIRYFFNVNSYSNYGPVSVLLNQLPTAISEPSILSLRIFCSLIMSFNCFIVYLISRRYLNEKLSFSVFSLYSTSHAFFILPDAPSVYIHAWPSAFALFFVLLNFFFCVSLPPSHRKSVFSAVLSVLSFLVKPNYGLISLLISVLCKPSSSDLKRRRSYKYRIIALATALFSAFLTFALLVGDYRLWIDNMLISKQWALGLSGQASLYTNFLSTIRAFLLDTTLISAYGKHGGIQLVHPVIRVLVSISLFLYLLSKCYIYYTRYFSNSFAQHLFSIRILQLTSSRILHTLYPFSSQLYAAFAFSIALYPVNSLMHVYYTGPFDMLFTVSLLSSFSSSFRRVWGGTAFLALSLLLSSYRLLDTVITIMFKQRYIPLERLVQKVPPPAKGLYLDMKDPSAAYSLKTLRYLQIASANAKSDCILVNDTENPLIPALSNKCKPYHVSMPFNWSQYRLANNRFRHESLSEIEKSVKAHDSAILVFNDLYKLLSLKMPVTILGSVDSAKGQDHSDRMIFAIYNKGSRTSKYPLILKGADTLDESFESFNRYPLYQLPSHLQLACSKPIALISLLPNLNHYKNNYSPIQGYFPDNDLSSRPSDEMSNATDGWGLFSVDGDTIIPKYSIHTRFILSDYIQFGIPSLVGVHVRDINGTNSIIDSPFINNNAQLRLGIIYSNVYSNTTMYANFLGCTL
jgi:hypothetical protein